MSTHEPATEPRLVLGPDDHGRIVSDAEFDAAYFSEPWTYERCHERLIVLPPMGQDLIDVLEPWCDRLVLYKIQNPGIIQYAKPSAWVRISTGTDRIGDLGVYLAADHPVAPIPRRVPDLMFAIARPGRESWEQDYIVKRWDYYSLGVREYVVVDRFEQQVTVFTHAPQEYERRVLTPGENYTSPLLPGLVIPLAEVLPS